MPYTQIPEGCEAGFPSGATWSEKDGPDTDSHTDPELFLLFLPSIANCRLQAAVLPLVSAKRMP